MLYRWLSRSRRPQASYSRKTEYRLFCAIEPMESRVLLSSTISFKTPVTNSFVYSASSIAAGQFNGDGKMDLAIADSGGDTVAVLLGNGDGTFSVPTGTSSPQLLNTGAGKVYKVAVADINGDGKQDIISAETNGNSGYVSIFLGNGDGTFAPPIVIPNMSSAPTALVAGTINGKPDIAELDANISGSDPTESSVIVLLFAGDGNVHHYSSEVFRANGLVPYSMAQGNINGTQGLIFLNEINGTAYSLTYDSSAPKKFDEDFIATAGPKKRQIAIGQLGTDGPTEFITGGIQSVSNTVLGSDGQPNTPVLEYSSKDYSFGAAAADFDGDGFTDIVGVNEATGALGVYYGQSTGLFTKIKTLTAPNVSSSSDITAVFTADVTGDGKPDLIVATGSKTISVFVNNSGTPQNHTAGPTPAFTSANSTVFTAGSVGSFNVNTTGTPTPAISEMGSLDGLTFTDNGNGTATISGTPAGDATFALTLSATNTAGTTAQVFTLDVDQAPAFSSPATVPFTVGTLGTFDIVTTGFPAAGIDDGGVTLPIGLTFTGLPNGTATITGTPGNATGGTYQFTLTATNAANPQGVTQAFTLEIDQPATITSANNTAFNLGTFGSFSVTTSAFPTASLSETGLPGNIGLSFVDLGNGTGTLAGTPSGNPLGSYVITFTAGNGIGSGQSQLFTLTIDEPPTINSGTTPTFTVGIIGTFNITANGAPVGSVAEAGTLPSGLTFQTFSNGNAAITGTPSAGTGGTYALTLVAANTLGSSAPQQVTLTVDQIPIITSPLSTKFAVGIPSTFSPAATSFPAASFTESGSLPTGVSFVSGNGTYELAGTPATGTAGTYVITLTAINGVTANTSQHFTLSVGNPVAPAITSSAPQAGTIGSQYNFTFTTTGFPASTLSETGTLPAGLTFHDNGDGTGTLSGTPTGSGQTYSLTFNAVNGVGGGATQPFTLTIDQPIAFVGGNNTSFNIGSPGNFTVTANGFPLATLSEKGTLPAGVTFVDNGNGTGTLSGTPAAGTGRTYPLIFSATNATGGVFTESFTLTINQLPTLTQTSGKLTVGKSGSLFISATGFPASTVSVGDVTPLDQIGLQAITLSNGTCKLFGVPGVGSGGTYVLTIDADQGNSQSPTELSYTLTIAEPPSFSSANNTTLLAPTFSGPFSGTFYVGSPSAFTVSSAGLAASPTLKEIGSLPSGLSYTDNGDGTGSVAGTAASMSEGSYTITLQAFNGATLDATKTFTLEVAPLAITSANDAFFAISSPGTFTVTSTGSPTATFSEIGSLPAGVSFIDNNNGTAELEGTPAQTGPFAFTITAQNSETTNTFSQVFTLDVGTVAAEPAFTSSTTDTFAAGQAQTFTVSTTGFPSGTLTETGAPGGVTFTDNQDGTGTLTGDFGQAGVGETFVLTFTAANASGTATQNFTLTVGAPQNPIGNSFAITTSAFPAATITEVGTLPTGVTLANVNGTAFLVGTPTKGGTYHISLVAKNSIGTVTQPFTLTVDQAPTFTSAATATFKTGSSGAFTITTGGFPVETLTESGTLPTGVSFKTFANGTATLSGKPATGTGGTYALTFTDSNSQGTTTQAFTLTVGAPVAFTTNSNIAFTENTTRTFNFMTSGFPGASFSAVGSVPGMSFVDNHNGTASLEGTPTTPGTYTLKVTASNPLNTTTQTCKIYVTGVLSSPAVLGHLPVFAATQVQNSSAPITPSGLNMIQINLPDNGSGNLLSGPGPLL